MSTILDNGFTKAEMKEMEGGDDAPATEVDSPDSGDAIEPGQGGPESGGNTDAAKEPTGKPDQQRQQQPNAKPPSGYVPQAALHEERQRNQELRDKVVKMEALFQRFQDESKPKAQPAEVPAYDQDPVGNLTARLDASQKQLDALSRDQEARKTFDAETARANESLNRYATSVREFSKTTTDFKNAYDYLADVVDKELIARGYSDPVERSNILQYEEGRLVGRAMAQGADPAQRLYEFAVHRGYKKTVPAAAKPKIEQLEQGQRAAKTIGNGAQANEGDSLEALAGLDGKDFDQMWNRLKRSGKLG